jgi:hypothetical protein
MTKIIREMESGDAALKRLQDIDKNTGFVDPAQKRKAEAEYKRSQERAQQNTATPPVAPLMASADGALDDKALAHNMLAQAKRMEIEAKSMVNEAARMKKDAQRMYPGVKNGPEVVVSQPVVAPVAPKKGRPSKAKPVTSDAVQ